MKIKTKQLDYEKVIALPRNKKRKPKKPTLFFRWLMKTLGAGDLKATNFVCKKINTEALDEKNPALYLMNHSSFIDLEIAATLLYPKPFNIVCTNDGFVGKEWLMRKIGCIPAKKFITDLSLVKDILYSLKELKSSVLLYPEASYSFDGTETPIPESLAKTVKSLGVPVVMIKTEGAFARDPLYNMLQKRKVNVSAIMEYILSPDQINEMTIAEIDTVLRKHFTFDNFKWQQDNDIVISEIFRSDDLNRVLYKCPVCGKEGCMEGKGTELSCKACGKVWELTETGRLKSKDGENKFTHIPDWYKWERDCVKQEIHEGRYMLDVPVKILMLTDFKAVYDIGYGRLVHDCNGFRLTGANGKLDYRQKPAASYSLYSDYHWYEIGDMISIGDVNAQYYCFPQTGSDLVAKTRLAAEELYKMKEP